MNLSRSYLYLAWLAALMGTQGSLFFGEIMKLPPCNLCWYQRICLYPLVLLLPVGIVRRDPQITAYTLPLASIGLAIAVYHNLLYYRVISEDLAPCTAGVPCSARQIEWLGFIGIPTMGVAAFVFILVCLLAHARQQTKERAARAGTSS